MKRIVREITQEQYERAVNKLDTSGLFSPQEVMGYGVYNMHFIATSEGKYLVSYDLGDSCD